MSRLYGRTIDVYSISKYLNENYKRTYEKDKTKIDAEEMEKTPEIITPYLPRNAQEYLDKSEIEIAWNLFTKDTIYSGYGETKNTIIFPTRTMQEEYRRDLIYFMGDLLRRINLDYLPDEFDIRCQYSDVLPLLLEYLFLRDSGKKERFSDKHLKDLALNAKEYVKIYDNFNNFKQVSDEKRFLRNTLLFLVPLSSMDATLQITDDIANDKESLRALIKELIENPNHNREEVMKKRNIDTYGYKRLRKEIDGVNKRR